MSRVGGCEGGRGQEDPGSATHLPGELFMPPPRSSRERRDRRLVAANKGAGGSEPRPSETDGVLERAGETTGGGQRGKGKGESLRCARLDLGTCGSLLTVSD